MNRLRCNSIICKKDRNVVIVSISIVIVRYTEQLDLYRCTSIKSTDFYANYEDGTAMMVTGTSSQGSTEFQEALAALEGSNNIGKLRSITKSFRLDKEIISKIDRRARSNKSSLNAEINNILRKYVEWDMLASKAGMIPISKPILLEIFQNIMTKEQVIDLANVGKNVILETAHFMKGNLTLESFLSWLKTRMELCCEVNYAIENNSPLIKIIFKHDLGQNWSIYHKIILDYIFHEILGENKTQIEATCAALILYIL